MESWRSPFREYTSISRSRRVPDPFAVSSRKGESRAGRREPLSDWKLTKLAAKISSHTPPHPTTMRLFLGLPIPPELAQTLTRRTQAIELLKGRRTAPENL